MADCIESIAMVGLGRLGCPIAACLAAKGLRVVGVDVNPATVAAVNRGEAPVYEPGLVEMLGAAGDRLTATGDMVEAIAQAEASFVLVPTPSEADGAFGLDYVLAACEQIGRALASKDTWHLVTIVSTVMPGDTEGPIRQTLERASGKRCGESFGLCYSPEFVALGSVIRDYLHPDMLLVGASDERSGEALAGIHRRVVATDPPVARMSFVNAELAKISVNSYVTTKITFANTLAGICERLVGADVDAVTEAIGLDSRIGRKYLRGGVGYGGPCFPRDNAALARVAASVGAERALPETVDGVNRRQVDRLFERVAALLEPGARVAVLGLSYKPESDVVEQSQSVWLAERLAGAGYGVVAFDPAARPEMAGVALAGSVEAAMAESEAVVLATVWPGMAEAVVAMAERRGVVVFDPWRVLVDRVWPAGTTYVPGGKHIDLAEGVERVIGRVEAGGGLAEAG
ncbi:UDP-glucose dehydrogenase family protein [Mucisphaera sp.]|uniref:UDP-glucose dehydrogenase family protein n=1 Tax=Mucisphaera sp. TaxID=2913024 RepID=UPI003D0A2575